VEWNTRIPPANATPPAIVRLARAISAKISFRILMHTEALYVYFGKILHTYETQKRLRVRLIERSNTIYPGEFPLNFPSDKKAPPR
jgi:hypothetical protein